MKKPSMLRSFLCHSEPRGRRISRRLFAPLRATPSNKCKNQKGFTLVEMIIVVALIGIIALAATIAIHQVLTGTTLSNDLNTAVNQVRNAGHWVSRDTQMAQTVEDNPGGQDLLELTWRDWDDDELHTVTYSLESMPNGLNKIKRSETDNGGTKETFIAQYIKPKGAGVTDCNWDGEVLAVTFTAQAGEESETRTFQVKPRPDITP